MPERLMQNNSPPPKKKTLFYLEVGGLSIRSLFWLFLKVFPWKKVIRVLDIGIKFKREFSFLTQLVWSYFKLYCAKSTYNGRQKDYYKAPLPQKKNLILSWSGRFIDQEPVLTLSEGVPMKKDYEPTFNYWISELNSKGNFHSLLN